MNDPFARIRVRRDQAELLYDVLFAERGRLIAAKIGAREAGEDPADLRADLIQVKYLMEEAERAIQDIDQYERGYKKGRTEQEARSRQASTANPDDAQIGDDASSDR